VSGCATASKTYTSDGKEGYVINCSGSALNWGMCYEKAGELCGAKGYVVLEKSGDTGAIISGSQYGFFGGSVINRSMIIKCKDRLVPELVNIELKPVVRSLEKPGTLIEKSLPDKEVYKDMGTEKKKTSFYSFEEIKEWHNRVKDRGWRKISESEDITHCYDSRNISYPSKSIVRIFTLETFESKKAINDKINHFRQLGLSTKGYENLYGTLTLQEINCNNKMYLPIYFMDYDKNRNPLNQSYDLSSNGWSEISSTMPTLEKLYKVVCPGGK
jgi:hypothetical protein